ncbi:MAG: bifunctional metallophosphatase/5'-nucleotidase [Deltaproteobacteria bacterium]|nr:bifunctional metallophosphatase/5'-nucleotidase [Deltaproteobacteria bacterium]
MVALGVAVAAACSQPAQKEPVSRPPPQKKAGTVTISIVGTNDLHGALERLPILAGYVANLRAVRAAEGGGVVLVDGGDMFQGTLESNLGEGIDVVRAYNEIGYAAAAVGNHEFDYGPIGPAVTAASIEDDARGALKARASEAKFPFVVANIIDKVSGSRIKWPNMPASTLIEVAGVKVGIIGAATEATPFTTMPANFADLGVLAPAPVVAEEAKALRAKGAVVVILTAHIGSKCKDLDHPNDTSSCEKNEELFKLIDALPKGAIDVIVAGHTHAGIAHRISDIAVIESFSSGRAFGRVDLRIAADGHITASKILRPQALCPGEKEGANPMPAAECKPGEYEGKPVVPDANVQKIVDAALAVAGARRGEKLGVTLAGAITKSYGTESAEGNWFGDLMLAARPEAQVAVTNGGGLRADLPAGELTYGQLFEAMPFDNRFAIVELKGVHLRKLVSTNLQRGGAILSWGGLAAVARCKGNSLDVAITVGGKPLVDTQTYKLATSDFLGSGGDGLIGRLKLPEGAVKLTDVIIRDAFVDVLKKHPSKKIEPDKLFSPSKKRMDYVGQRPVACGATGDGKKRQQDEDPE